LGICDPFHEICGKPTPPRDGLQICSKYDERSDRKGLEVMKKPRIGRPSKEPTKKQRRVSLTFRVLADVKRLLIQSAQKSGRSLAAEAEALIEKALAYDRMLAAMNTTIPEMQEQFVKTYLHRQGFMPIRGAGGIVGWKLETDARKRSGFVE
jgi:TraY domain